jgi:hypothetical protein
LYYKNGKPRMEDFELEREVCADEKRPELIESEIAAAVNELKKNKAEGVDGIPAEFLKLLGEKGFCKSS